MCLLNVSWRTNGWSGSFPVVWLPWLLCPFKGNGVEDGNLALWSTVTASCFVCACARVLLSTGWLPMWIVCLGVFGRVGVGQFYSSPVSRGWVMSSTEILWRAAKQDVLWGLNCSPSLIWHTSAQSCQTQTNTHFPLLDYIHLYAHVQTHQWLLFIGSDVKCPPAWSTKGHKCWNSLCLVWKTSKHTSNFTLETVL